MCSTEQQEPPFFLYFHLGERTKIYKQYNLSKTGEHRNKILKINTEAVTKAYELSSNYPA